ncbi:MAG: MogA/MoaB family molybdenum cofactor biosynthesis protein [Proteobacteria bacterium]|nr:MogA/MoaB family molybdenum cofactor biosynthesis protein [Pseudomonadota bacterium]
MTPLTCAVLTISTKGSQGLREDKSGPAIELLLREHGFTVVATEIVPDHLDLIQSFLITWTDIQAIDLIITTGGTGVSPTDITPEATREVIDTVIPGLSELMRFESGKKTMYAALSRGICGIRKQSLIINLPGSVDGATHNLQTILPVFSHAIYKIKGGQEDCSPV